MGSEPRCESTGLYLLREGDWKRRTFGWPTIPEPWRENYLLKKPITAFVQSVVGYSEKVVVPEMPYGKYDSIRCKIGAGTDQGLRPGMILLSQDRAFDCRAYVLTASEKTSIVLVADYEGLSGTDEITKAIQKGLQFSTKRTNAEKK
jgi:hypothetical protein